MFNYYIEAVYKNNGIITIVGWAVDSNLPEGVKIELKGVKKGDVTFSFAIRPDVNQHFHLPDNFVSGFTAVVKNGGNINRLKMHFAEQNEFEDIVLEKDNRHDGQSSAESIGNAEKRSVSSILKSTLIYLRANGFVKTFKKTIGFLRNRKPRRTNTNGSENLYIRQILDIPLNPKTEYVDIAKLNIRLKENDIKYIAYYLPQFYPFEENDKWWGKGFTEWTNVSKAVPQFVGHYQPRLPGELGFYDLRLKSVQERQVELASQYGIYGFCFHYYWFEGKRLLEVPLDSFVENENINFPFCLCWANENWTRRWDGQEDDVLISQNHSDEDDLNVIKDLERYMAHKNYIKIEGKPVIIIYRVTLFPDINNTIKIWRDYLKTTELKDVYVICAQSFGITAPGPFGCDAAVAFPPHIDMSCPFAKDLSIVNKNFSGNVFDYSHVFLQSSLLQKEEYTSFKTICPGWDNTARKPEKGHIFHNSSPAVYRGWLDNLGVYTHDNLTKDKQYVFINAWNEWGEGAYLEPDRRYGYAYLDATKNSLLNYREKYAEKANLVSIIVPLYNHECYIEDCLQSVQKQSHKNKELIIIDDCSSDNSVKTVEKILSDTNFRQSFSNIEFRVHSENKGAYYSINEGFDLSNGDYITIINSDDMFEENRLSALVEKLQQDNGEIGFSNIKTIDKAGRIISMPDAEKSHETASRFMAMHQTINNFNNISEAIVNQNVAISTGNMIFTRDMFLKLDGFNEYQYIHDWDFILRACLIAEPVYVKNTSYLYRLHSTNTFEELDKDGVYVEALKGTYSVNAIGETFLALSGIYKKIVENKAENSTLINNKYSILRSLLERGMDSKETVDEYVKRILAEQR